MPNKDDKELLEILRRIEKSLQQRTIIELYKLGISQPDVARNLGIGAGAVNKLLKGAIKHSGHGQKPKTQNSSKTRSKNR